MVRATGTNHHPGDDEFNMTTQPHDDREELDPIGDDLDLGALVLSEESILESLRVSIPGYSILKRIGRGGQGSVFLAERTSDHLRVAIKMMNLGAFSSKHARSRFQREANALKVLKHPGIVQILDLGETSDGNSYLVTEFIEGQLLDQYVESIPPSGNLLIRLKLFLSICRAMASVHRSGVIHRDISPSNIIVDSTGNPRIIDFGLAQSAFDALLDPAGEISQQGDFCGKLDYASPEQFSGEKEGVSQASDVYSLGVILYFLMSGGRLPFNHGGGDYALVNRITRERPDPLPMPRDISMSDWSDICRIIGMALEKLPSQRYQDAGELVRPIENIVQRYASQNVDSTADAPLVMATIQPVAAKADSRSSSSSNPRHEIMKSHNLTNVHLRNKLIAWAQDVRELLHARGDHSGMEQVSEAIEAYHNDKYTIAIIGKAKRGKSTLLNAMLGRRDDLVAPVDKLPASSAITRFSFDAQESADVLFRDERCEPITFEQIRSYVTEEGNPSNAKEVACVHVRGPFPGLDHDMELVDTPGADSMHAHHDELLHGFIPQADAVIYMVTARMPIDASEKELLRKVKAADSRKIFFVINRIDELSAADLADAVDHNTRELGRLGVQVGTIHQISAKRAFQGDISASRLPGLCHEIQSYLAEQKGKVLARRFVMRILSILNPIQHGLEVAIQCSEKSAAQLDIDLKRLQKQRSENESKRKFAEREFSTQWNSALDQFAIEIGSAKDEVVKVIRDKIDGSGLTQLNSLTKELPTIISAEIEDRTLPIARKFEQSVSQACRKFVEAIPDISIPGLTANIAQQRGPSIAPTALGGVAAITTGGAAIGAAMSFVPSVTTVVVQGSAAPAAYQAAATAAGGLWTTLGGWLGLSSAEGVGAGIASMFTTTATTTTAHAAPLWVAMAGPVGWTLIGVGAVAVPIAWRISKLKQKDKIASSAEAEVTRLFRRLESERTASLRRLGDTIAKDIEIRLEREFDAIESAITETIEKRPTEEGVKRLKEYASRVTVLLSHSANLLEDKKL